MHPTSSRRLRRLAAALAVPVLVLLGSAPAAAHVDLTATTTAPGATTVVRLSVEHGCDGSPTTEVAVRVPDEVTAASATSDATWEVDTERTGDRVTSIVFRAGTPLPDGRPVVVELEVRLPDRAGARLAFPTLQTCERGELAWLEVADDERDAAALQLPAPVLVVSGDRGPAAAVLADPDPGPSGVDLLAAGVLGVGVLGAAAAAAVLARRRRHA